MTTPRIEEIVKAQRPKLLPTELEMDAYERRIIEAVTSLITQAHQAGNKARDKRWMEMLVEHSKLDVVDALRVYVKVQTSDDTIKALTSKK